MRNDSYEYREWKQRQNQKNLIRRSRRTKAKKRALAAQNEYNRQMKSTLEFNSETKKFEFHAPLNFSLINNPEETIAFFNKIISFILDKRNYGKSLFIDISRISSLTIDALMYLLAIVNNLSSNFANRYTFSGNTPTDERVRKMFTESGFYHFVRYLGTAPIMKNDNNVQIVSGEICDTALAKRISDFVCEKANVGKRTCSFLYNMVIELMSNTHKHAYTKGGVLHPRWYCYAEYEDDNTVSFSFMDTGAGIPSTVKKKFSERLDFLGIKGEHKYIVSALNGDFRTSTQKGYRGKGLPKIREFCTTSKIANLHILANKADVRVNKTDYSSNDLISPLLGSLFYWQIDLTSLKGGAA